MDGRSLSPSLALCLSSKEVNLKTKAVKEDSTGNLLSKSACSSSDLGPSTELYGASLPALCK